MSLDVTKPFYHFSVDDVFDVLIEVTDRKLELFTHPFFRFLKEMHDEFGMQTSLYLFFQKEIDGSVRTLREVTDVHRTALQASQWLRFGPHTLDYAHSPYAQMPTEQVKIFDTIYKEINRFAGSDVRARWVRLHYFSESYELADYFHKKGVEALFTTDKDAISYRIPDEEIKSDLARRGYVDYRGMTIIRSHGRIENLESNETSEARFSQLLSSPGFCIFFTHEVDCASLQIQNHIRHMARFFRQKGIPSFS